MMIPRTTSLRNELNSSWLNDVVEHGEDEDAADRADDAAAPAGQRGAAQDHRGDRLEVVAAVGDRRSACRPRGALARKMPVMTAVSEHSDVRAR